MNLIIKHFRNTLCKLHIELYTLCLLLRNNGMFVSRPEQNFVWNNTWVDVQQVLTRTPTHTKKLLKRCRFKDEFLIVCLLPVIHCRSALITELCQHTQCSKVRCQWFSSLLPNIKHDSSIQPNGNALTSLLYFVHNQNNLKKEGDLWSIVITNSIIYTYTYVYTVWRNSRASEVHHVLRVIPRQDSKSNY